MFASATTTLIAVIMAASSPLTATHVPGSASFLSAAEAVANGSDGVGVEWVVSSSDTFGDAIDIAVKKQGSDKVAAALSDMSDAAASGKSVDFPGLDVLPAAEVADLTDGAATALEDREPLPVDVENLPLGASSGGPRMDTTPGGTGASSAVFTTAAFTTGGSGGVIVPAGAGSGGLYWQFEGFIRRGVTTGGGGVKWTDRLNWDGRADPGAVTSRLNYNIRRALDNGFFSNWGMETRVSQKKVGFDHVVAATGKQSISKGNRTDYMTNDPRMNGESIKFTPEFSAKGKDGNIYSDQQKSDYAACEAKSKGNVCRWG